MVERVCPPTHVLVGQDGPDLHVVNVSCLKVPLYCHVAFHVTFQCVRCLDVRISIYALIDLVVMVMDDSGS